MEVSPRLRSVFVALHKTSCWRSFGSKAGITCESLSIEHSKLSVLGLVACVHD
jgi:hypothetical protein